MTASSQSTGSTLGALVLVFGLLAGVATLSHVFRGPGAVHGAGKDAPDFTVPIVANSAALGADTFHLKELAGRPVLLDFWATWCGPCRAEAPILDRVSRRWKDRGLMVVGVNTDRPDEGDPRLFAERHGLSYPIARDEKGFAQRAYDIDSLPTLVVVSRTGKIVAVRSGITDDGELERLINLAM